jgi:hypothetical protein
MNVFRESMALKQKVWVLGRAADVFEIWPCAIFKLIARHTFQNDKINDASVHLFCNRQFEQKKIFNSILGKLQAKVSWKAKAESFVELLFINIYTKSSANSNESINNMWIQNFTPFLALSLLLMLSKETTQSSFILLPF